MNTDSIFAGGAMTRVTSLDTIIVGGGAAAMAAAVSLIWESGILHCSSTAPGAAFQDMLPPVFRTTTVWLIIREKGIPPAVWPGIYPLIPSWMAIWPIRRLSILSGLFTG